MRKYDLYVTNANGSYAEETSFDVDDTRCLEPVAEDAEEDEARAPVTAKEAEYRKRSRLGKIFDRLRHRNGLAKAHSLNKVSSTRVETGSVATLSSMLPDARSRETRDDDTTVAIDNTTASGNFKPFPAIDEEEQHRAGASETDDRVSCNDEDVDEEDDDDVFAFPDDFSTTALASLPEENQDIQPHTCRAENIWIACKVGDEEYVRDFLQASPEAIHGLQDGRSPLYFASLCGHETIVRMLLAAGATDPERTAELSALNQSIRTLLKDNRKRSSKESMPKATPQASQSIENCLVESANNQIGVSEAGREEKEKEQLLPQLSSISTSSSKTGSNSDQSNGAKSVKGSDTNRSQAASRRFIPKLSKKRLSKSGLFDTRNFSLPDLSNDASNRSSRRKAKAKAKAATETKPSSLEAAIDSRLASHGVEPLADESVVATILSTSFIDCTEVVLPDLFFEAPPVEAYRQSEVELHEPADAASSEAEEIPALIHVRTYDAKELLPKPISEDMELPTLKASVCGVTAVLEEDVVEEKRPKVVMSWMESDVRKVPEDEVRSFDTEEEEATLMRSANSVDEEAGFLTSLRDFVCHAFDAISDTLKRE